MYLSLSDIYRVLIVLYNCLKCGYDVVLPRGITATYNGVTLNEGKNKFIIEGEGK